MLNARTWTLTLAIWMAVTYLLCIVWGLIVPTELHTGLLELFFPGFVWLTAGSLFLGLVESAIYGAYAGLLFAWLHNRFYRAATKKVEIGE